MLDNLPVGIITVGTTKVSTETETMSTPPDATSDVTTQLQDSSSKGPETKTLTQSYIKSLSTTRNEFGADERSDEDNGSGSTLAIVVPVCITFLIALLIIVVFYWKR